ncbi:TetR/AcrR family transcriptional regulator [Allonocardiopsis opalescens]|uniref:TetR family transcriptional regulator n=1 Tax=Allonocardiopsis opalescens TaxID=1144618 RepID=A0A2T0QAI3_9ACTN|nr:TetR/AcrR family transcriptional regulator [Allonocardiopsis opalescens]PRY00820.1 TetR family transcriptional regulator [Allonocardiopsis opalescens]
MPKVVDHEARRQEIVEAAWRVIVREGIDGATTRAIAREAGYSNGVLTHYFADKADILLHALRLSHQRIVRRLHTKLAAAHGLAALRALLLDNLPLDAPRAEETRLEIGFWGASLGRPGLAEVQRSEGGDLRDALRTLLDEAAAGGEIVSAEDPDDLVERLLALVDGLSLHHVLYPDRMPAARVERLLLAELDRVVPVPEEER